MHWAYTAMGSGVLEKNAPRRAKQKIAVLISYHNRRRRVRSQLEYLRCVTIA